VAGKTTERLGVVYFDICWPMKVETPGGNMYILTFIDDITHKMRVYLLRREEGR